MNQRPTGVTILAILAFIGGGLAILFGALAVLGGGVLAAAGGGALGGLVIVVAILYIVLGAFALYVGWGYWNVRPGAWRLGVILSALTIVLGVLSLLGGDLVTAIVQIAVAVGVIYYLTLPDIRAAFGQPTGGGAMDALRMAFGMGAASGSTVSSAPPPPPAPPASPPPASTWTAPTESTPPSAESEEGEEGRA